MMDKVWIVTRGDYSDYHIVNVFSNKGEAEKFKEKMNNESTWPMLQCEVEEWDVDAVPKATPKGLDYYEVFYFPETDKTEVGCVDPTEESHDWFNGEIVSVSEYVKKGGFSYYKYIDSSSRFKTTVLARNKNHAAKQCTQMYQNLKQHGGLKE